MVEKSYVCLNMILNRRYKKPALNKSFSEDSMSESAENGSLINSLNSVPRGLIDNSSKKKRR